MKPLFIIPYSLFIILFPLASCTHKPAPQAVMPEPVAQEDSFMLYSLHNEAGFEMAVTNYGARLQRLVLPSGQDVVLGYDTLSHYQRYKQNFGAVVGRYIGRILSGHMKIDGTLYQLPVGENGDCSHGGTPSFSQRFWQVQPQEADSTLTLRYVSPDGENGFPGELTLDVTYTLLHDGLRIDYAATTTKATVLNPSNHSFFNLTGDLAKDILDEELWIDGDSIALYNPQKRVTGQMGAVADTPLDFRFARRIGDRIDEENDQLKVTGGYDHCYLLNNEGSLERPVAVLSDKVKGVTMEVYTTEPAMQIYTANGHKGNLIGKEGKAYPKRNAICFETMHFPDSPNKPHWPSTLLRPGETFRSTTMFRF